MILIDTDVLVEVQRRKPRALSWVQSLSDEFAALPAAVVFEMLVGSADQNHLKQANALVNGFRVELLMPEDTSKAIELMRNHVLSTGLGLGDYLIAAQALNRSATLYTFNMKHFRSIPGLDVEEPYERDQ